MLSALNRKPRSREARPQAIVPPGQRVYAIGDIHGRLDLLSALAAAVEEDNAARDGGVTGPAASTVVLLGDLIDRGPDSLGVLRFAYDWQRRRRLRILLGNHEEMLLSALESLDGLKLFIRSGGRETLLSFGIDENAYHAAEWEALQGMVAAATPDDLLDFIWTFEDQVSVGDYLFVHAGIMPEVALQAQSPRHLRWIREPFLSHPHEHDAMVVHGHTISDIPDLRANRIGLDTGAYASGVLTAMGFEHNQRWLIQARGAGDSIAITQHPA